MEKRVLLIAYACDPYKGSEGRLGWNWVKHLSRYHEVWVITRSNNKSVIEKELHRNPSIKATFLYYDLPKWARFWKRGRRGYQIYYYLWQIGIYFRFRKLIKENRFDIVQHVTFGNNWQPSFLALASDNFVWGPIGGEDIPFVVFKQLPLKVKIKEAFRSTVRFLGQHFDPFVWLTAKKAKIILECSSKWAKFPYPKSVREKIFKVYQNGIDLEEIPFELNEALRIKKETDKFKIVFIGEFVAWKGILFVAEALKGFALKAGDDWEALVAGYGPEYKRVKKSLAELGEKVKLPGRITMGEVWNILKQGHVFLYPSFHHGQSTIVMQAMACGLPIICLEGDATAETVDSNTGIIVKLGKKDEIILGLTSALLKLYYQRELAYKMGKEAQKRVIGRFSWNKKIELANRLYRKLSKQ